MTNHAFKASCQGYGSANPAPCLMVIFGASGDLTRRSLLPSLFELTREGLLPEPFAVLGVARSDWDDDHFRRRMREALCPEDSDAEGAWEGFAQNLNYLSGDFQRDDSFQALRERIGQLRHSLGLPDNLLFHLAVPPDFFAPICERLNRVGLANSAGEPGGGEKGRGDDGDDDGGNGAGWRRVIIEKPLGEDRTSARALHADLQRVFAERQIYRIDHFLGKETVQNMLVFRFANPAFEPIWNHRFIDHVQLTVAEDIGIGTRGSFYEDTGVVRDMIQNHLLSLLSMVALEPPVSTRCSRSAETVGPSAT